jgi:four helix bundle protein
MGSEKKFDLQDRLIDFAVKVIKVTEALPNSRTGNHIRGQLLRCGTSAAANYGEAQSAESRSDFIHKIKIVLKELRETKVWMILIQRAGLIKPEEKIKPIIQENDELISIFVRSEQTAKRNRKKE